MNNVPERFCADIYEARQVAAPLLLLIKDRQNAEPSYSDWTALAAALTQGDPLADDVVSYFSEVGHRTGWQLFEAGLNDGAAALREHGPLFRFFSHCETPPPWLDQQSSARGCDVVSRSGKTGMRVLRDFGLMAGYQASAVNQTLVKTGALAKGAQRRVAETTKWWMDCTAVNGMKPGAPGYRTTLRVRVIHALVRATLSKRTDWDHRYYGLPVNQLDMQVTYLAFSVMFLLGQRLLGVPVSRDEGADLMHLWRHIGWLMGVDDALLADTEQEGRIALYRNLISQALADDSSKQLARALMDEPLQRHYPNWQWLRSRWDRQVHLSIIRFFIGARGMQALGLPAGTLPWYPLIFAPGNFAVQSVVRLFPGGKGWLARRGRRAQEEMLGILFGEQRPDIIQVEGQPHRG